MVATNLFSEPKYDILHCLATRIAHRSTTVAGDINFSRSFFPVAMIVPDANILDKSFVRKLYIVAKIYCEVSFKAMIGTFENFISTNMYDSLSISTVSVTLFVW